MKRVYCDLLPDVPYIPLLYPNLGAQERGSILFLNNAFRYLTEPLVTIVNDPSQADCILLPHNFASLSAHRAYTDAQAALAKSLEKKLIIFWHGDSDAAVPYDNALVFRTSQYRSSMRGSEIMMPAYAEDLSSAVAANGDGALRKKHASKPIIGFCGWADYKNLKNRIGTVLKNSLIEASGIVGISREARIKGITYRMKALRHLSGSDSIEPHFIIRSSYSGHASTIKTDPVATRREYVDNLLGCDYALSIKGDGNYSYRFYEALSLGRIPVLLDTQCVLPLEHIIDYDRFIVRVPYWDLYRIDRIVADHYASLSDQEFSDMQMRAREAFETYLRVDRFLEYGVANYF